MYSMLVLGYCISLFTIGILSILFLGFIGLLIHRYNLFQMLICYELQSIGFNIFLIIAAITINDINMLGVTVLLFAGIGWLSLNGLMRRHLSSPGTALE